MNSIGVRRKNEYSGRNHLAPNALNMNLRSPSLCVLWPVWRALHDIFNTLNCTRCDSISSRFRLQRSRGANMRRIFISAPTAAVFPLLSAFLNLSLAKTRVHAAQPQTHLCIHICFCKISPFRLHNVCLLNACSAELNQSHSVFHSVLMACYSRRS